MNAIVLLFLSALLSIAQTKTHFGDAPVVQPAVDLSNRIADTYRGSGTSAAIKLMDTEGRAFLKNPGATGRFDFFHALRNEALRQSGRDDLAWGTAVIEWIYRYGRDDGENYWYREMIPEIYRLYVAGGRYAAARDVLTCETSRLAEGWDTDIEISRFPAKDFVRADFPEFQRRVLSPVVKNARHTRLLAALGSQDLAEGKWRRALEEAAVCSGFAATSIKWYAEHNQLIDAAMVSSDLTGIWRTGSDVTAKCYEFLGMQELELAEYESISEFRTKEDWARQYVDLAKARAAHLRYVLGKTDSSVINELATLRTQLEENQGTSLDDRHRVTLLIADIHFRENDEAKGWELIDGLLADASLSSDMKFQVLKEWCRHRVRTSRLKGVETILSSLLAEAREGGVKRQEIDLYQIYARFLIAAGRLNDALRIQNELLRLLRCFDLYPRLPEALYDLARIQSLMGQLATAASCLADARAALDGKTVPSDFSNRIGNVLKPALPEPATPASPTKVVNIDLQPRRSMMIPLANLPARGLFSLTNPDGQTQSGKLVLRGPGLTIRQDPASGQLSVEVAHDSGQPVVTHPLTLAAGDAIVVDLSLAASEVANGAKVDLSWEPEKAPPQLAEWRSENSENGITTAITDASEYLENPFYLIPIYHLLQYQDDFEQALDVRVIASQPTRVELYDQEDRIVIVDAEGDGELSSKGDLITHDLNGNSLPDLRLAPGSKEQRFRLFVQPLQAISAEGLVLELQLRQQGRWITYSTDRLLPGAK